MSFDHGGEASLPARYVTEHLRLGYGLTAHRAQGLTVEHTLLLGSDTLYRELGYSALSRGRHTNSIYLTDTDVSPDHIDAIEALVERLSWSRAQLPAVDALPCLPDLGDSAQARGAWIERIRLAVALTSDERPSDETRPTPPAEPDLVRYKMLTGQLAQRERLLGHAVRWQQPDWARTILGPLPTSRTAETDWLAAAGAIAAYRERWDITTDTCPEPPGGLQRVDWIALTKTLDGMQPPRPGRPASTAPVFQPDLEPALEPAAPIRGL